MQNKRPTLEDVARAASVSKTTASLALNGKAENKIPSATRARVLAAADALQFRPHGVARALTRRRADVLGVICTLNPFVELAHHAFEQALLSALFHHALDRGYNPMIYGVPPVDGGGGLLTRYADGRSDAFVLLYPEPGNALLECLPTVGIPAVALCCRAEGACWVDSDHAEGVQAAIQHLVALGHRRIAYLVDPVVDTAVHARVVAFRETLRACGLPVREDWIVSYGAEEAATERQVAKLFQSNEKPTALLTFNDFAAGEAYSALRALGLRIPEDVSVVGFDDIPAARTMAPPLTTVRQDVVRMARAAVDLAIQALSEKNVTQEVVCPVELVIRHSTAPPMERDFPG